MKAKYLYEQGQGRESLQKSWKDKKNAKSDKRRKGFKPPFNRNEPNINHQYHYAKGYFKKEYSLGKGEDHQSNAGDARKIIYTRIVHT
jgi:hypothetical protein